MVCVSPQMFTGTGEASCVSITEDLYGGSKRMDLSATVKNEDS